MPKKKSSRRLVLLALVLLAIFGAWMGGLFDEVDADSLLTWLRAAGPWGGLLYVLAFATLQAAGLSVYLFMLTAMVLWPAPQALALTFVGAMCSATTGFWFARYFASDWVQGRVPMRFRHYEERLEENGLKTVLIIRFLFFTTFWMNWLMGASKVRYRDYMIGTAIGELPMMAAFILLGASVKDLFTNLAPGQWQWVAGIGLLLLLVGGGWWWWRRRRAATSGPVAQSDQAS